MWLAAVALFLPVALGLRSLAHPGRGRPPGGAPVGARHRRAVADVALAAALVAASALSTSLRTESQLQSAWPMEERTATVTGIATSFPRRASHGTRVTVRTSASDSSLCARLRGARILLRLEGRVSDVSPGDTVTATGLLRGPRGARNPGGFSEADYLFLKRTSAVLAVPAFLTPVVRQAQPRTNLLALHVGPVRRWIEHTVSAHVEGEERAILLALLLGERGELTWETRKAFRDSGTVHLLAVSGLHAALVALTAMVFLRGLRLSTRASMFGGVAAVWFYCSLSGFHPSTLRASVMVSCYASSKALGRNTGAMSPLCTSCAVLVLINPSNVWEPGFQLSYAATFFIVAADRLRESLSACFKRLESIWRYVISPGLTTCIAQMGVLPVLALHFGAISTIALPTNLLAIPLVSGALVSALCALGVAALLPQLASVPLTMSWLLLRFSMLLARFVSSFPNASLELARPGLVHVAAFFVCLTVLLRGVGGGLKPGDESRDALKKRRRLAKRLFPTVLASLGLCWLLGVFVGLLPSGTPRTRMCVEVDFLDVGQGDAAVVRLPGNGMVLIDGGESVEDWDNAERLLVPFLRNAGKRAFDVALVTHFHSDHAGGILGMLERRKVREIFVTPADTVTALSRSCRRLAERADVPMRSVSRPDTILTEGEVRLLVQHPSGAASADTSSTSLNDSSVVLTLDSGRFQFVFTGDVGATIMDGLSDMVRRDAVTVVKAPHHGSSLSLSELFNLKVRPRYVVFSAGRNNRFGHPSDEVVSAYREQGAEVYRTDRDGCVTFTVSGDSLLVRTARSKDGAGRFERMRARRSHRRLTLTAVTWCIGRALVEQAPSGRTLLRFVLEPVL